MDFDEIYKFIKSEVSHYEVGKLKVVSKINYPGSLVEAEDYRVDLTEGTFEILYEKEVAYRGDIQVIATFNPKNQTLLWGRKNSSIPVKLTEKVRPIIENHPVIGPLALEKKIAVADHEQIVILDLIQWVTHKAQGVGAYPAYLEDKNVTLYLALMTFKETSQSYISPDELFCCACLRHRFDSNVAKIISFPNGSTGLCNRCIELTTEIVTEMTEKEKFDYEDPIEAYDYLTKKFKKRRNKNDLVNLPCHCCGDKKDGIYTTYVKLCFECLGTSYQALKENR